VFRVTYRLKPQTSAAETARKAILAFAHAAAAYGAYHPRTVEYLLDPHARDREDENLNAEGRGHILNEALKKCESLWSIASVFCEAYKLACDLTYNQQNRKPKSCWMEVGENILRLSWRSPNSELKLEGNLPKKQWVITIAYNRNDHAYDHLDLHWEGWEPKP